MKRNSLLRTAAVLLAFLLLAGGSAFRAFAEQTIDLEREGAIRLSCLYDGEPVSGGNLLMYRVGEIEQDADGRYYFRLLDRFGGDRLDQKALDTPGLVSRLVNSGGLRGLEYRSTVFDASGKAGFDAVEPGLYLLGQSRAAPGFRFMGAFLVSVPYYVSEEEGYIYEVDASVKPAVEREVKPSPTPSPTPRPSPTPTPRPRPTPTPTPRPTPTPAPTPPPKIPQTGQLNWPVPVLAGLGLLLLLLGSVLLASDRPARKGRSRHE